MNKFILTDFRNIILPSESEIMHRWLGDSKAPKVSFVCTTYNHEGYIEDTIRGFLLQETVFPFEILIHDDASSDDTANIIKHYSEQYSNIISSTTQTKNQYCRDRHFPLHSMFNIAKGKYIAICEGDDFWLCRNKIAKQVQIHESNSNISLTYSKAFIYRVHNGEIFGNTVGNASSGDDIYFRNAIPTLTVMFEKKLLAGFYHYVGDAQQKWLQSDYQMWLWLNLKGQLYFDDKVTSVYRVSAASASRPRQLEAQYNFRLSSISVSSFFAKKNLPVNIYKRVLFSNHIMTYLWCLKRGMSQAQKHKHIALENGSLINLTLLSLVFNLMLDRYLIPALLKLKLKLKFWN